MKVSVTIGVTKDQPTQLMIDVMRNEGYDGFSVLTYELRDPQHRKAFRVFAARYWREGYRWNGEPHPDVREYVESMYDQMKFKHGGQHEADR